MTDLNTSVLLVIDVQVGIDALFSSERNNLDAESNIQKLINNWRERGVEIIHVKHNSTAADSPLRPGQAGNDFKPEGLPLATEQLFEKTVNSAFIGTGLEAYLKERGVTDLVIVGLTTDHCISTSTRMAGNLGFDVSLVSDATATFGRTAPDGEAYSAEQVHKVNLLSLHDEFCRVVTTEEVLQRVT